MVLHLQITGDNTKVQELLIFYSKVFLVTVVIVKSHKTSSMFINLEFLKS